MLFISSLNRAFYGWRAGSGLFFFWWTKNMLNLTAIGGPRHRYYFAWHYIIFSTSSCSVSTTLLCRCLTPVVRQDICRCILPMASLPIPTHLLSPKQASSNIALPIASHSHATLPSPSPEPPSHPTERRWWPPDILTLPPPNLKGHTSVELTCSQFSTDLLL